MPQPHPLAFHEGTLWIGSWENHRLYGIDPQTWTIREEHESPGKPFGIAPLGDELRVVISLDDDDRYLFPFRPGRGFDVGGKRACPDLTGSYLASQGGRLYLGQMTNRRILVLANDASVEREIALPTRCAGLGFGPGGFHMISGDQELEHLVFGTLDASQAAPSFQPLAPLPDEARSLAHDGSRWWTCLRDRNEMLSFIV
ncbi:MAG TPA: hypothetical protein VMH02_04430 [Verrucomicrobiae bacterium]|nr:hypothetical protein [Verrucomicrobiae bacterium]